MALAERVGCSTTLIGNIETMKRFPSADNLDRIAEALEIPPSELFAEESPAIEQLRSSYEVRERIESKVLKAIGEAFAETRASVSKAGRPGRKNKKTTPRPP
jgi:transcriptional regulator with XRE-family HTH domain